MNNNEDTHSKLLLILSKLDDTKEDLKDLKEETKSITKDVADHSATLAVMAEVLKRQHDQLAEHIRRTNLLEQRVEQVSGQLHADMLPMKEHLSFMKKSGKLALWVIPVASFIITMIKMLV